MGLDMNIIRKSKPYKPGPGRKYQPKNLCYRLYFDKDNNEVFKQYGNEPLPKNLKPATYINVTEEAYWRKANQIHKWFVDNIQDGIDDCSEYLLTEDKLKELYNIVNIILDKVVLKKGKVISSISIRKTLFGKYKDKPNYTDGMVIKNPKICKKLLPTQKGFFFGHVDYDEYYYENLTYTKEVLEDILKDFDKEDSYYYTSSW